MTKSTIARIENDLIFNGKYQLRAKEQKVVLFLASKLNPQTQTKFLPIEVKIKNLESLLSEKKNGSFVKQINEFIPRLLSRQISFLSNAVYKGERLEGHFTWFSSILPFMDEDGDACVEFTFNRMLKPFLLELREYTQIDYLEVLPLGSSFSIRMYQIFKAHRAKMEKHQKKSKLSYQLSALKELLEVDDKYDDFRNFKKKVLEVLVFQINTHTSIGVRYDLIRKSRKVDTIQFVIWNKDSETSTQVTGKKKVESLTFAQVKANDTLLKYGVAEGIALEMLSKAQGSEIVGFEDWYFQDVIRIFESKTNQEGSEAKAGTLVNWFLKKKVFEQGDMFAKIMERLQEKKKALETKNPKSWDNRLLARGMSAEEFRRKVKA